MFHLPSMLYYTLNIFCFHFYKFCYIKMLVVEVLEKQVSQNIIEREKFNIN